jgi:Kef-type K+ transport system membrane component KefB
MTLLLLQMSIVLTVTLICGWLARKLGQTRVVGEIVGGILLGPSVLGHYFPHIAQVFTPHAFAAFENMSTVGLILYLFLIGMELDYAQLYRRRGTAVLASGMSILFPFAMAALLAHSLRIRFAPHGIGSMPFVLFLGIAMSITAFPVLARMLEERRLQSTSLGTTAILCAAVDDVVAWLLLAFALALLGKEGGSGSLAIRMAFLAGYLLIMFGVVRPLANLAAKRYKATGMSLELLGFIIIGLLLSAAATDAFGIHPLFGAFLAGVCFPRIPRWQEEIRERTDMLLAVLLLPLFFALIGMRTRLDLLNDANMWLWAGIVLAGSVAGKMGGAVLAARWNGQSWRNAGALGALLNTRGVVQLIVLNIAYNVGVFSPTLFAMLVVMVLVTTILTSPILKLLKIQDGQEVDEELTMQAKHSAA